MKPVTRYFLYLSEPNGKISALHYIQGQLFWEYSLSDIIEGATMFNLLREADAFRNRDELKPFGLRIGKLITRAQFRQVEPVPRTVTKPRRRPTTLSEPTT